MKRLLILCTLFAGVVTANAQKVVDNFTVGPYVVDYLGDGEVKYRLRDKIDLYEFFELRKDTTIVAASAPVADVPVKHAIQVSGYVGSGPVNPKEIGASGVWKQNVARNLYFNGGISIAFGHDNTEKRGKRNMFEFGFPLQIEWTKLSYQKPSLFGIFGITPTAYATMSCSNWDGAPVQDYQKKSGFLIAPALEFGGNIPVGRILMRIGVYGQYKINCTTGEYDIYKQSAGRVFLGAKIGVVL